MPDNHNEIAIATVDSIQDKIYVIRGVQVMLDFELAELYGYTTKRSTSKSETTQPSSPMISVFSLLLMSGRS